MDLLNADRLITMDLVMILEQAICLTVWLGTAIWIEKVLVRVCPYGALLRAFMAISLSLLLLGASVLVISAMLAYELREMQQTPWPHSFRQGSGNQAVVRDAFGVQGNALITFCSFMLPVG
jgi:hypothetical protein